MGQRIAFIGERKNPDQNPDRSQVVDQAQVQQERFTISGGFDEIDPHQLGNEIGITFKTRVFASPQKYLDVIRDRTDWRDAIIVATYEGLRAGHRAGEDLGRILDALKNTRAENGSRLLIGCSVLDAVQLGLREAGCDAAVSPQDLADTIRPFLRAKQ